MKYYIDTSVWMDFYEDRNGFNGEPLGNFAWHLLGRILARKETIVVSDLLMEELQNHYPLEEINGMFNPFIVERRISSQEQRKEAMEISKSRNVPRGDALHAILARDHNFVLVTRDNHFKQLRDISAFSKPEEVI